MAVRLIPPSVGASYEGLSGDAKPTGVVINSTFREQDTQSIWITYDGTTWVLKEPIGGVYTTPTHTAVTVGANTTVAKAANASRLYACFANDGTETIYLGLGVAAVMNIGIPVLSGGSYEMSKQIGNLYVGAVNAICASGGMILAVTEGV